MMTGEKKLAMVTGGAGFIGSHLVEALISKGLDVRVVDDLSTGSLSNLGQVSDRITFYEADIQDGQRMDEIAEGCEWIFHEAAEVSVPRTVENPVGSAMINEIGTLNVLEAARKNSVKRVVLASSCAVYGNDPELPKNERMAPLPQSPYAVQKLTGEIYAGLYKDLYGLDAVCLRYFNVYGPRQDPSSPYSGVISIFMTRAAAGEPPVIHGDGSQSRDFIFVEDVVRANLLAAEVGGASGEVMNIGTGAAITIQELWETVCALKGVQIEPEFGPPRSGDIKASRADIGKAKSILGFQPIHSFEKGLKMTLDWYEKVRSSGRC